MFTAGAVAGVILTVIAVLAALIYFRNPVERICCRSWTNLLSFRRGTGRVQYCRVRLFCSYFRTFIMSHNFLLLKYHIYMIFKRKLCDIINITYIYATYTLCFFIIRSIPLRKPDFCSTLLIPHSVNRIVTTIFYMHSDVIIIISVLDCRYVITEYVITERHVIFNISISCRIKCLEDPI